MLLLEPLSKQLLWKLLEFQYVKKQSEQICYKVGNKNKNKLKSAKRFRNNHRQCSTDKSYIDICFSIYVFKSSTDICFQLLSVEH